MQLTRIEKENMEYFSHLCPEGIMMNDRCVKLGVIDDEGYAISMCAVSVHDPMAVMEWIMTAPEAREHGAATYLVRQVHDIIEDMGLEGIETGFSSSCPELSDFLAGQGFAVADDRETYAVPVSDLVYSREVELVLESENGDHKAQRFPEDKIHKRLLISAICNEYDLVPVIFARTSSAYSVYYAENKKDVSGALCVSEYGDRDLYVDYLISEGSAKCISALISGFYDALIDSDRVGGRLFFTDRDGRSADLVERLTETDRDAYRISDRMYAVKLF